MSTIDTTPGKTSSSSGDDSGKKIPRYQQTTAALSLLLDELEPGTYLPSEPTLAQQLGVSRATLREAMRTFEGQGRIVRRQGIGTYVTDPPSVIESGIETLESIEVLAQKIGLQVSMGDLEFEDRVPTEEETVKFEVPSNQLVTEISRVILAEGRPVAYLIDVLPSDLVPRDVRTEKFTGSVLDLMLKSGKPTLRNSVAEITAVSAAPDVARHLQIQRGDVLLCFESWLYSDIGMVVDHSKSYFLPGTFRFHLIRRVETNQF